MVIKKAIEVLKIEAEGILALTERIDENFTEAINIICSSSGRVIISGIGKSGLVGRKIVATLNSTGTSSLFLHPVEAMHGDLGIVCSDDIFLALSNSGETDELNVLLPSISRIGCKIIALTGNKESTLARHSDIIIDVGVAREACPLGLAPTASTTALLAMGDALAVVLISKKCFKQSDFKKFHPGGKLGRQLSRKVSDIMLTDDAIPLISEKTSMEDVIIEIDRRGLGATLILKDDGTLSGIITDGDIRRIIANKKDIYDMTAEQAMTKNPRTEKPDAPAYDALHIMEKYQITILPIINSSGKVQGILHLHDILGKGDFKFNGM